MDAIIGQRDPERFFSHGLFLLECAPRRRVPTIITASEESHDESSASKESSVQAKVGGSYWFVKASMQGSYSSKKDSRSTKDSRYSVEHTVDVHVHAVRDDVPGGLARMLAILTNTIEKPPAPAGKPPEKRRIEPQQAGRGHFGALAATFGATEQLARYSGATASAESAAALARAGLGADYYRARLRPPHCGPGGLADTANRTRWERLQPWLAHRIAGVLAANLAGALVERALLARLPDTGLPAEPIRRAVAAGLVAAGWPTTVQVALDLRSPAAPDTRARTAATFTAVRDTLAAGGLALVEPVHNQTRPPLAEPLLLIHTLGTGAEGATTLLGHEADAPETPIRIDVTPSGEALRLSRRPPAEDRTSLCGLRAWRLAPATPPRFGPARVFRHAFP